MAITVTSHCCFPKQLDGIFRHNFSNGRQCSTSFLTDGDWTFADFINWICWELPGTHLHLMLQSVNLDTLSMLRTLLSRRVPDTSFAGILQDVTILLPKQDKRRKQQDIPQDVQDELVALSYRFANRIKIGYGSFASNLILFSGGSFSGEGYRTFTMTGDFGQSIDNRQRLIVLDSTRTTHDDLAEQIERLVRVWNARKKKTDSPLPTSHNGEEKEVTPASSKDAVNGSPSESEPSTPSQETNEETIPAPIGEGQDGVSPTGGTEGGRTL